MPRFTVYVCDKLEPVNSATRSSAPERAISINNKIILNRRKQTELHIVEVCFHIYDKTAPLMSEISNNFHGHGGHTAGHIRGLFRLAVCYVVQLKTKNNNTLVRTCYCSGCR